MRWKVVGEWKNNAINVQNNQDFSTGVNTTITICSILLAIKTAIKLPILVQSLVQIIESKEQPWTEQILKGRHPNQVKLSWTYHRRSATHALFQQHSLHRQQDLIPNSVNQQDRVDRILIMPRSRASVCSTSCDYVTKSFPSLVGGRGEASPDRGERSLSRGFSKALAVAILYGTSEAPLRGQGARGFLNARTTFLKSLRVRCKSNADQKMLANLGEGSGGEYCWCWWS